MRRAECMLAALIAHCRSAGCTEERPLRCTNRAWAIAIAFALTVGVVAGRTSSASAQAAASSPAQVKADFKGIIGLGLVGAELGFILPAVAGVDDTWSIVSASSLAPAARGIRVEVFGRSIRIEIEAAGGEGAQ